MFGFLAAKGILFASVIGAVSVGLRQSGFWQPSYPVAETSNGAVRGYIGYSRDGRGYAGFIGIPYAKPPVGSLRFEPPVAVEPWDGIREANRLGSSCFQYDAMVEAAFMGDEDCLYLNVYTPDVNLNASLPVMVWIHGGGFFSGGSGMYDPKYFMDEDVVIVTMNYRLGPLGFLNTGDNLIRGNMGLKDQNLAMRWVKQNIDKFGGNKNKITLFGESAGSASVHYHILSPASKGLFNKAIMQSGAATAPWSFTKNPREQANRFGKRMNCPTESSSALIACLRKLSPKELSEPLVDFMNNSPLTLQIDIFTPSVETIIKDDTFLAENPYTILKNKKFSGVPLMIGMTSGEGGLRSARLEANVEAMESFDDKWDKVHFPLFGVYDPELVDVSKKMREYYFPNQQKLLDDKDGMLKNLTKMFSDGLFFHAIHRAAEFHSKVAPVNLYYYDYRSSLPSLYSLFKATYPSDILPAKLKIAYSIAKDMYKYYLGYPGPHEYGPCHGDDLIQAWRVDFILEVGQRGGDYEFSKKFVKSLVDFAKDDKNAKFDGVDWPKIDQSSSAPFKSMKIDNKGSIVTEPYFDRLTFWNSLNIRNY